MGRPAKKRKINPGKKTDINPELDGFDIKINPFGEIQSNYDIETINNFLNKNLRDKKLGNRLPPRPESQKKRSGK
ncbi:hypothetical protein ACFLU5_09015 [Bacteroidota bacterium]